MVRSGWLRLPPIPSHTHTDEAGAEQEQGGGFGDGARQSVPQPAYRPAGIWQ